MYALLTYNIGQYRTPPISTAGREAHPRTKTAQIVAKASAHDYHAFYSM